MTRNVAVFLSIGLLVVAMLAMPSDLAAQWGDYMIIQPPQPTEADEITVIVGGEWGYSCAPRYHSHFIVGNTIVIDAVADAPPDVYCLTVLTPWEFATNIGQLPIGSYTVMLRIYSLWGREYPARFGYFDVVESPCYDFNDSGVVDIGDIALIASAWGARGPSSLSLHDFNSNRVVDVGDIQIVAEHWRDACP